MSVNPFNLKGKTILITGASSGIGETTVKECAKMGASSCILVARSKDKLEKVATQIAAECECIVLSCDLSDFSHVEEMVNALPQLDGVVCNAGINKMKPVQFYTPDDVENIFAVNCFSPMLLVKQLVKKKKLKKGSSIVFTASISGHSNVSVGNGIYGASKSALSAFMKYAALELSSKSVRCNAVHPGRIETPLIHNGITDAEAIKADIEKYPLKRYGTPQDVAYAIIYLLSDASAWVTGTDLVIDGGRSLV